MPDLTLSARCILVVEDEYFLSDELRQVLEDEGATVLGPVARVDRALALVGASTRIDAAVLDINLNGEMAFPIVDVLMARRVPILLVTGYGEADVPERYAGISRCHKPVEPGEIARTVARAIEPH
jgi:DNA-binding NtrC family response regulator